MVRVIAKDNAARDMGRDVFSTRELEERESRRQEWKRDLSGRANGTIDPMYGCFLAAELEDYALNFSLPWSMPSSHSSWSDVYPPDNRRYIS